MDFSSRFSRRTFVKTAAMTAEAATLGGALAACSAASGAGGTSSSTVTLTYWDWYVSQAPWVDNEIKLFQQAHPDIKIKKTTQGTENYDNLYALAFKSHNAPDVAMIPQKPKTNIQVSQVKFKPFAQFVGLSKLTMNEPDPNVRNLQTANVELQAVKPDMGDIMAGFYTGQIANIQSALSDLAARMQKAQDDAIKQAQQKGYKVSAADYTFPDWDLTKPYVTKPAQS